MLRFSVSIFVASLLTGGGCEGCGGCTGETDVQLAGDDDSAELPCNDCTECTPQDCPEQNCDECAEPATPPDMSDDSDLDSYEQVAMAFGTVMVAPAGTTQANAWVQVQCPDDVELLNCSDQEVVLRSVHVWSVQAGEFEPVQDFCPGTDLDEDVQWSAEIHLRGVNNNLSGGALFYGPNDGLFTIHPDCGLQFRVLSGWYTAPMSCDIYKSCDNRVAQANAQYYWDIEVCRLPGSRYPDHELVFRTGFDWLSCRGSQCPDGNDDRIGEVHTPWFAVTDRSCVHVSP